MLYGTMVDNVSFEYSDESSGEGSIKNSENYGYALILPTRRLILLLWF